MIVTITTHRAIRHVPARIAIKFIDSNGDRLVWYLIYGGPWHYREVPGQDGTMEGFDPW